jgi:hypothetical protein
VDQDQRRGLAGARRDDVERKPPASTGIRSGPALDLGTRGRGHGVKLLVVTSASAMSAMGAPTGPSGPADEDAAEEARGLGLDHVGDLLGLDLDELVAGLDRGRPRP